MLSVEKESEELKKSLSEKTDKLKQIQSKVVGLELENEDFEK